MILTVVQHVVCSADSSIYFVAVKLKLAYIFVLFYYFAKRFTFMVNLLDDMILRIWKIVLFDNLVKQIFHFFLFLFDSLILLINFINFLIDGLGHRTNYIIGKGLLEAWLYFQRSFSCLQEQLATMMACFLHRNYLYLKINTALE